LTDHPRFISGYGYTGKPITETEAIAFNRETNLARLVESGVHLSVDVRTFETGATRDTEDGKLDYEAFLSPLVLERYARYMDAHRTQKDGTLRDGDNWQKGIPRTAYMKSAWRHFVEFWGLHRGHGDGDIEEALCATLFNLSGYLHEFLKNK
jgi:hypothetical protein